MSMFERTRDAKKKDRMIHPLTREEKSSRHGQAPKKQQRFLVVVSMISFCDGFGSRGAQENRIRKRLTGDV
jgi:hypothetical protein